MFAWLDNSQDDVFDTHSNITPREVPSWVTEKYPKPPEGYGHIKEEGPSYGSVHIKNYCDYSVYIRSVGARALGGPRENLKEDYGTKFDHDINKIVPGGGWQESFRITCPRVDPTLEYCPDEDKVTDQGVSIKIAKEASEETNITQFEYFLVQKPGDSFRRFHYDVALIDCATNRKINDLDATDKDHDTKKKCPGYEGGISVTFNKDTEAKKCPPIFCDGQHNCLSIYTFEWTQRPEANKLCEQEYRGDVYVGLCMNKNPATAK